MKNCISERIPIIRGEKYPYAHRSIWESTCHIPEFCSPYSGRWERTKRTGAVGKFKESVACHIYRRRKTWKWASKPLSLVRYFYFGIEQRGGTCYGTRSGRIFKAAHPFRCSWKRWSSVCRRKRITLSRRRYSGSIGENGAVHKRPFSSSYRRKRKRNPEKIRFSRSTQAILSAILLK